MEGYAVAEVAIFLNQLFSILPAAGVSFWPRVSRFFPTNHRTFDFRLLFLPFRGTTNKQAEKSGACSTPDSLQNSPLILTFGFDPWEHNNLSKIPGCKKSKHLL